MDQQIVTIITLTLGGIGTVLGILNFTLSRFERRVRLRVIPKAAISLRGGFLNVSQLKHWRSNDNVSLDQATPCIEITNLSTFPVSIDEIGYCMSFDEARAAFLQPTMIPDGRMPYRLESRQSATFYAINERVGSISTRKWRKAYVETSCGTRKTKKLRAFPFAK